MSLDPGMVHLARIENPASAPEYFVPKNLAHPHLSDNRTSWEQ